MTKQELTEQTIATWQPRTLHKLSKEDAREITENLTGFFTILAEWSHKEHRARSTKAADCHGAFASRGLEA
jgi:hypothetical protein